jgi:prevent-host-death family protein
MQKTLSRSQTEQSDGAVLLPRLSSTELKSNTGEAFRQAAKGAVAITRHNRAEFVILTAGTYDRLVSQPSRVLAQMSEEFDTLLARMNTPAAAAGFHSLFAASPQDLGRSAVAAAKPNAR